MMKRKMQRKHNRQLKKVAAIKRRSPEFKEELRKKFIETAKKYIGVPYAKRYHKPGDPLYDAPIFLDCCALVRQVVRDLREDFGFTLGRWNQNYQLDTLPIVLTKEQMRPGDLIFWTAQYYDKKKRRQKHDCVHVEIYIGPEDQSLGSRWQKGTIKIFDTYKFVSKSYHSIVYHYRSLDTWLNGICKSFCDVHSWDRGLKEDVDDSKFSIFF